MLPLTASAHRDTFCRDHLPPMDQWPDMKADLGYPDRLNCAGALLAGAIGAVGAERPCLLPQDPAEPVWSYGDLAGTAGQIAWSLVEDLGVVAGNRVLLFGYNSPWLAAAWCGVLLAGGVAVTVMPMLRSGEIAAICEIAQINIALCDHRLVPEMRAADVPGMRVVSYHPGPRNITVAKLAAGTGMASPGAVESLNDLALRKSPVFEPVSTAADDVALIAFTSGTTGRPKASMHFHKDVLAIADTFSKHLIKPTPDDVFSGTPPLAFTFGLGALLIFPLRAGASVLLIEQATPAELAEYIGARGVTVLSTAPTAYRALLAVGEARQLRGLRCAVSAGEALPASVWQAFHDATGIRIMDGIGTTEMLHMFICAPDEATRPGSSGLPVPGYQAVVIDAEGCPVPDGEPGRLAVKGPTGCRYLADDRQRDYVQNGWNITGDIYVRDPDGYFWHQGRHDDLIISAGYNISGQEIEQALVGHPEVADCGVVGVAAPTGGQTVKAFVVLAAGVTATPAKVAELQDHVRSLIAPFKCPRIIEFRPALPRTANGKLQRYKLRAEG